MNSCFQFLAVTLFLWSTSTCSTHPNRKNHFLPQDYETTEVGWWTFKEEPVNEEPSQLISHQPSEEARKAHEWLLKAIEAKEAKIKQNSASSSSGAPSTSPKRSSSSPKTKTKPIVQKESTKDHIFEKPIRELEENKESRSKKRPEKRIVEEKRNDAKNSGSDGKHAKEKGKENNQEQSLKRLRDPTKDKTETMEQVTKKPRTTGTRPMKTPAKGNDDTEQTPRLLPKEVTTVKEKKQDLDEVIRTKKSKDTSPSRKASAAPSQEVLGPKINLRHVAPKAVETPKTTKIIDDNVLGQLPSVLFQSEADKLAAIGKSVPLKKRTPPTIFGSSKSLLPSAHTGSQRNHTSVSFSSSGPKLAPAQSLIVPANSAQLCGPSNTTYSPISVATRTSLSLDDASKINSKDDNSKTPSRQSPPQSRETRSNAALNAYKMPVRTQRLDLSCIKPVETKLIDWDVYHHEASNTARIVIFNLTQSITSEQLLREFNKFGRIMSVQVIDDHTSFNRPCLAFIEFETDVSANSAVGAMAGKKIEDCTVGVDFSTAFFDRRNRIVAVKFTEDWRYINATDKFKLLSVPLNTALFGPALFSYYNPVEQIGLIVFNFSESAVKFMTHLRKQKFPLEPFHP